MSPALFPVVMTSPIIIKRPPRTERVLWHSAPLLRGGRLSQGNMTNIFSRTYHGFRRVTDLVQQHPTSAFLIAFLVVLALVALTMIAAVY